MTYSSIKSQFNKTLSTFNIKIDKSNDEKKQTEVNNQLLKKQNNDSLNVSYNKTICYYMVSLVHWTNWTLQQAH